MAINPLENLIPKSTEKPKTKSLGLLATVLQFTILVCLLVTIGVYGMVYVNGQRIMKSNVILGQMPPELDQNFFDEAKILDQRLALADQVFGEHLKFSNVFKILERLTIRTIRYEQFEFNYELGQTVKVSMFGQAASYSDIANQSKIFSTDQAISSHLFYDFVLLENGQVSFKLDVFFRPEFVRFDSLNS